MKKAKRCECSRPGVYFRNHSWVCERCLKIERLLDREMRANKKAPNPDHKYLEVYHLVGGFA